MKNPLRTLLYELFVLPIVHVLAWILGEPDLNTLSGNRNLRQLV